MFIWPNFNLIANKRATINLLNLQRHAILFFSIDAIERIIYIFRFHYNETQWIIMSQIQPHMNISENSTSIAFVLFGTSNNIWKLHATESAHPSHIFSINFVFVIRTIVEYIELHEKCKYVCKLKQKVCTMQISSRNIWILDLLFKQFHGWPTYSSLSYDGTD